MTKHASGKYGRVIGQKERKAGWPAPATAWCYLCNSTHSWVQGCEATDGRRSFTDERSPMPAARTTAA